MVTQEEFAENTFAMAYARTGWKKQIFKTCEECGELIQAFMKEAQSDDRNCYTQNMLKEMGHVELCIEMLKFDLSRIKYGDGTALYVYSRMKSERLNKWHEFEALEELKRGKEHPTDEDPYICPMAGECTETDCHHIIPHSKSNNCEVECNGTMRHSDCCVPYQKSKTKKYRTRFPEGKDGLTATIQYALPNTENIEGYHQRAVAIADAIEEWMNDTSRIPGTIYRRNQ